MVLSSRKYDPSCSSRIRILIFFFTHPVPDSGVKKITGSRIWLSEYGTWKAATPVLAVTKVCSGGSVPMIFWTRKLFPVPAPPVKKTFFPAFTFHQQEK